MRFLKGLLVCGITLLTLACLPLGSGTTATSTEAPSAAKTVGQREYLVRQRLVLTNAGPGTPEKQNLWVALIHDFPPYQTVKSVVVSPKGYSVVVDEYGNSHAEFDLSDHPPGAAKTVSIEARVVVNELTYDLAECKGGTVSEFLQPELHIESANPQIARLAQRLSAGKATACQKARAFYDYIGDHLTYTYNGRNWGAQAALGPMGADCTEYASLLIALSRAQGIPARYFEGLRYLKSGTDESARVEHAWADVYLPGSGWVAMDPTLGRTPLERDTHFAHYTPGHIIVTMGSSPSTLRGSSYWTHVYWPGDGTKISVEASGWEIELLEGGN